MITNPNRPDAPLVSVDPTPPRPVKKESSKARRACQRYCELGTQRSLKKLADALGRPKSLSLFAEWCRIYGWVNRANEHDAAVAQKRREDAERRAAQEAELVHQRERELNEKRFKIGMLELDQAEFILKYPMTEVKRTAAVDENGRETQLQVIKPAHWCKRDGPRMARDGVALVEGYIRNARGMASSEIKGEDTYEDVSWKPEEQKS